MILDPGFQTPPVLVTQTLTNPGSLANAPEAGVDPIDVVIADWEQTGVALGDLDIAVLNQGDPAQMPFIPETVDTWKNDGNGGFGTEPIEQIDTFGFAAGFPAQAFAADLDDDGFNPAKMDLAVSWTAGPDVAQILRGNAAGGFAIDLFSGWVPAGTGGSSIVVVDVDDDGDTDDLVVANSLQDTVTVLVNRTASGGAIACGAPRFNLITPGAPLGFVSPEGLVVGLFDADTNLDVISGNIDGENLTFLSGNGNGTFDAPVEIVLSASVNGGLIGPVNLLAQDLDTGGDLDLVLARIDDDTVEVLFGDGMGGFTNTAADVYDISTNGGSVPWDVAVGFFDDGPEPDLAVSGFGGTGTVSVFLGVSGSAGTFTEASFSPIDVSGGAAAGFASPTGIVVADFDGTGGDDIAVSDVDNDEIVVLLNDTATMNGSFDPHERFFAGPAPDAILALVLDPTDPNDTIDLVVACDANFNASMDSVNVLEGDGSGGFALPSTHPVADTFGGDFRFMASDDLDVDGSPDVVASGNQWGCVSVLLNDGTGGFLPQRAFAVGLFPAGVGIGLFNNDNIPDIVTANFFSDDLSILIGQ